MKKKGAQNGRKRNVVETRKTPVKRQVEAKRDEVLVPTEKPMKRTANVYLKATGSGRAFNVSRLSERGLRES
jgi:hypothetical protein